MKFIESGDMKGSWAMPFACGSYYNVHWSNGPDFTHISIAPSDLWTTSDAIVLRFNYTAYRDLYQIGKFYQQQLQTPILNKSAALIDPVSCQNGDYYHDKINNYLFVCVSGRNKTKR